MEVVVFHSVADEIQYIFMSQMVTVLKRYIVALSFPTLVFFVQLSLKFVLHTSNLKGSRDYLSRASFKGDYISRKYGI